MKNKALNILAGTAILASSAIAAPVLNPNNGHYYEVVAGPLSWANANAAASASSYLGLPGHLVTFTSAAENNWFTTTFGYLGSVPWIGLYQPPGSAEPTGGWTWVTGEAYSFTNWKAGEPNNLGGEHHALFWDGVTPGAGQYWNDGNGNAALPYIVEYEAAQGVPDAGSSMAFLGLAFLGVAGARSRFKR